MVRPKRPKPPVPREADILAAVLSILAWSGILYWRVPLSPVLRGGPGPKARLCPNPMKGFPDIAGVLPGGRLLVVEVKRPGERLRPEQAVWRANLEAAGALYVLATSVEDVRRALRENRLASR